MPTVRYYDYGVMRMESERRMLDAQRLSAERENRTFRRVTPDISTQTRPAAESEATCQQSAPEYDEPICTCTEQKPPDAAEECCCTDGCVQAKTCAQRELHAEELLIAAILLLALSEGGNLPLVLALLYLLM